MVLGTSTHTPWLLEAVKRGRKASDSERKKDRKAARKAARKNETKNKTKNERKKEKE
jgi:hypothetical protein